MKQEYAFYKGESLIVIGTAKEIANHLGIKEETVKWYTTPTNINRARKGDTHNRRVAVRL